MSDAQLKPCECARSGSNPWFDVANSSGKGRVRCSTCMASTAPFATREQAVAAWNRRAPGVTREPVVTLAECPIGLFVYGDTLCLKTEYGNNQGRIDAYIVVSGEFFWGDAPQTIATQRASLVAPLDTDAILALIGGAG